MKLGYRAAERMRRCRPCAGPCRRCPVTAGDLLDGHHVTGRIASPSTLTMASVVQRLSTDARGCLGSRAGLFGLASGAGHRIPGQELRHRLGDRLGTLDVQEMPDTLDGAVLDLREPGVEQGPAVDEQLHG